MPPVYIAKYLGVKIPVHKNGPGRFCIRWRPNAGVPPVRETFTGVKQGQSAKARAEARADEIARGIGQGLADVLTLTHADRDSYRAAVQALAPTGIPLHTAIAEYLAARAALPEAHSSLLEAARAYTVAYRQPVCPPSAQILAAFLAMQEDNHASAKYLTGLKRDLTRFVGQFPSLPEVTEEAFRTYLRDQRTRGGGPVSDRRRDNIRDTVITFATYATRKPHHLPQEVAAALASVPQIARPGTITTRAAGELLAVLTYFAEHDRPWLPWAATAALAGLRTSEIFRLEWKAFKWTRGTLAIPPKVAQKIHIARQPPLLPALAAWLSPWRLSTGHLLAPVIAELCAQRPALTNAPALLEAQLELRQKQALRRMRAHLGWGPWQKNVLRHSYGSHRLAVLNDMPALALEMGNSIPQIRDHYNDSKDPLEAAEYFAALPPAEYGKIISIA